MNNADGLRPEALNLSYTNNGDTEAHAATAHADTWKTTITGDTASVVPVWDKLSDEADGYSYTVTGEKAKGFTITMNHAPQATVNVVGTVMWDDGDNIDGKRPNSVTLHLYKNGEEIGSKTVAPDASGNWAYSFGEYPLYEDYKEVVYTVVEDSFPAVLRGSSKEQRGK